MRYGKGHKAATRKHIVNTAARRFRQDGIDGVGVASLMTEAGLTHGGFYNHFRSKEELVRAAIGGALDDTIETLQSHVSDQGGGLEALIRTYLDSNHRDSIENGCAIGALSSDIARRDTKTRRQFDLKISDYISWIARYLPKSMPVKKRSQVAAAIASTMLGALQLSRLITDDKQSRQVLRDGIEAALDLAYGAGGRPELAEKAA